MENLLKNEGMSIEEAVQLAKEIERVESSLSLMKEKLKRFVDQNGEVDTGEKIWGYSESVSWKFDADGLKKVAEGIVLDGKNPWEMLNISSTNIKKLGWGEDILGQYGTKKINYRFSSRRS